MDNNPRAADYCPFWNNQEIYFCFALHRMVEVIKNIFIKELRQIIAQYGIFVNRQSGCTRVLTVLKLNFQGGTLAALWAIGKRKTAF
jgi:hypothetical protein